MSQITPANTHPLLDPPFARTLVDQHLQRQVQALRDAVTYGSNLLLRLFKASWTDAGEAAGLGGLTRHAIMMADAASLALEGGAVPAATAIARGVVEARIGIAWMLRQGVTRWGRQFYVSTLRAERRWYRRLLAGTSEHLEYVAAHQQAYGEAPSIIDSDIIDATDVVGTIDKLLVLKEYVEINGYFEAVLQRSADRQHRASEPEWYRAGPGAPNSVANMAERIGLKVEYLNAYRHTTEFSHGVHPHSHVRGLGEGTSAEIVPIRDLGGFGTALNILVANLVCVYKDLVEQYRLDEGRALIAASTAWIAAAETPKIRIERQNLL